MPSNLAGFVDESAVIEEARRMWASMILTFDGKRWINSHRSGLPRIPAQPFDRVLRKNGIRPETLHTLPLR